MDSEERRNYNKNYYEKNKKTICSKLFTKEACPICKRVVSHQNLRSHQKSSYCKSRISNSDIDSLKSEIENLKKLIESKN